MLIPSGTAVLNAGTQCMEQSHSHVGADKTMCALAYV